MARLSALMRAGCSVALFIVLYPLVMRLPTLRNRSCFWEPIPKPLSSSSLQKIAAGDYFAKSEDEVFGTGYVVKSLEAALWCFWTTDSFKQAILKAANLGDDADTTAAICGQVAGAFYGESGIPSEWLQRLVMVEEIGNLAERLQQAG